MSLPHKLVITCPQDAVALTPYLLGFHPENSLVILGWSAQGSFAVRLDLVGREHYSDLLLRLFGLMVRNDADAALLLGYGPRGLAVPLLSEVQDALEDIITVKEVLHVDEGRWLSLMCTNPECCPPEGTPYDITTSHLAAHATFAGLVAYGSREEMAATVAPVEGKDRDWMVAETERAERELLRDGPFSPLLVQEGLPLVRSLIGLDRTLTDQEVARLGVVLTHLRVRDEAWTRLTTLDPHQQLRLWQDMTRRTVGEYTAAPAALLAFLAYINGDGALAAVALDRCRQATPFYSMAGLIEDCLSHGLPPNIVREKFNFTPETLAEAWGDSTEHV